MRCSVLVATVALLLTVSPHAVAQFETRGDFVVSGPSAPYSLAVGDFNRDGILDIAAVLEPPGTVNILIGCCGRRVAPEHGDCDIAREWKRHVQRRRALPGFVLLLVTRRRIFHEQ